MAGGVAEAVQSLYGPGPAGVEATDWGAGAGAYQAEESLLGVPPAPAVPG